MADKIQIDVEFNLKKAKKAASQAARHFENTTSKAARKGENQFGRLGKAFSNSLNVAAASVTFRIVNGLIDGFKQVTANAIDFQRQISEINTLLPGFNTLNSKAVSGLKEMSAEFGKDRRDLASAYYNIISAGVTDTVGSLELLRAATQASTAGLTEVNTASGAIISVMQAYSESNLTAQESAEKLFETVVIGRTRFEDLASKIGQVVPVAAQAGITINELLGFLGEATRTSGNTARTVTALRSAFTSILGPSEQAKDTIKQINKQLGTNIEFSAKAVKEKGFVQFLDEINTAANRFENKEEILKKLFGNVRGLSAILSVASNDTDKLAEAIERIEGASELATSELEALNNVSGQWALLVERLTLFVGPLAEAIAEVTTAVLNITNAILGSQKAQQIFFDSIQRNLIFLAELSNNLLGTKFNIDQMKESLIGSDKPTKNFFDNFGKGAGVLKKAGDETTTFIDQLTDLNGVITGAKDVLTENLSPEIEPKLKLPDEQLKKAEERTKARIANLNALIFQKTKQTFESLGLNFAAIYNTEEGKEKVEAIQQQLKDNLKIPDLKITPGMDEDQLKALGEQAAQFQKDVQMESPFSILKQKGMEEIGDVQDSLTSLGGDMYLFSRQAKKNIAGTAVSALSKGFEAMGAGAMKGSEMVKAAGQAIFGAIGDMIITEGKVNIATGLGRMLKTYGADGGPLLAQGLAMTALGGFIKAKAGGGGGSGGPSPTGGGGGAGGGAAVTNEPPEFGPEVLQEQEPRTQINVNIEGNVLDSRSSSLQIVELINEAYNRDGVIVEQGV